MAGKATPKQTIGMCTASDSACICRARTASGCDCGPRTSETRSAAKERTAGSGMGASAPYPACATSQRRPPTRSVCWHPRDAPVAERVDEPAVVVAGQRAVGRAELGEVAREARDVAADALVHGVLDLHLDERVGGVGVRDAVDLRRRLAEVADQREDLVGL